MNYCYCYCYYYFFEIEGRQKAVDHLASFPSDRKEISQPGIEPPTSSLRFKYLSTIIW
jgi:hypothetical protein